MHRTLFITAGCILLSFIDTINAAALDLSGLAKDGTIRLPLRRSSEDLTKRNNGYVSAPLTQRGKVLYEIVVGFGTPPQYAALAVDTGSANTWVPVPGAGTNGNLGTYSPAKSSSDIDLHKNFTYRYGTPNSLVTGEYYSETVTIGGAQMKSVTVGAASYVRAIPQGLLGLGPRLLETAPYRYPTVVEEMVRQGLIKSQSYSMWLDDLASSQGQILFGAFDSTKYTGKLITLPMVPDPSGASFLDVVWSGFKYNIPGQTGAPTISAKLPKAVILDSGTSLSRLPSDVFQALVKPLELYLTNGRYYIPCSKSSFKATFDFTFGSNKEVTITVPMSELVLKLGGEPNGYCYFGLEPSDGNLLLGDTFLRSAYVVYNLDDKTIALGNAKNY